MPRASYAAFCNVVLPSWGPPRGPGKPTYAGNIINQPGVQRSRPLVVLHRHPGARSSTLHRHGYTTACMPPNNCWNTHRSDVHRCSAHGRVQKPLVTKHGVLGKWTVGLSSPRVWAPAGRFLMVFRGVSHLAASGDSTRKSTKTRTQNLPVHLPCRAPL